MDVIMHPGFDKAMLPDRPTIAVDFDGTIVDHQFPEIGPLKRNVKNALSHLQEKYFILIYSCRSNGEWPEIPDRNFRNEMGAFLNKQGVPYDAIYLGGGKPFAEFYIDDRAIRFQNNWEDIRLSLMEYKV